MLTFWFQPPTFLVSRSKMYGNKSVIHFTVFCWTLPKPKALHFSFGQRNNVKRTKWKKKSTGNWIPLPPPWISSLPFFPGKVHQFGGFSSRAMLGSWFYPTILPTKTQKNMVSCCCAKKILSSFGSIFSLGKGSIFMRFFWASVLEVEDGGPWPPFLSHKKP